MEVILASASPRRKALLARLGIVFRVAPANITERPGVGESATALVARLAGEKAAASAAEHPGSLVIGADTVVVLDERIMGKPVDRESAAEMLRALSGRRHLVQTAVALEHREQGHASQLAETTAVVFHDLTTADIDRYLDQMLPLDKAGAYGIQDFSGVFVRGVEGCYHNVMGFPLAHFYRHLQSSGLWSDIPKINNL